MFSCILAATILMAVDTVELSTADAVSGLGTGPVAAITVTVALFLIFIISVTIVVIVVGKAIWKKRHKASTSNNNFSNNQWTLILTYCS